MNGFNLSNIQDAKLGGTSLSAIYLGSNKLWPTAIDYSKEYFAIESLADNNTISFKKSTSDAPTKTIYWSRDKTTWHSVSSDTGTIKTLNNNEKIYIKGNNNSYASSMSEYNYFRSTRQFNISGNIMSLIYGDNFIGQTKLTDAYTFCYIFIGSKVVDAIHLILPATTLRLYCYSNMFSGCTSLTTAPELPATTLNWHCYQYMFSGCTSLTTAPELPATTLDIYCYQYMFSGCTSLTTAPELPATTLAPYCYNNMFYGCTSLNYIKMLATDISATNCLQNWVSNVAPTGTFVKEYNLKSIPINSISGIPVGWTIEEVNAPDFSKEYLTIESLADNNTIKFNKNGSVEAKTIYWSSDKTTWNSVSSDTGTIKTLNNNEKIYIKGNNNSYASSMSEYNYFNSDAEFNISGNIMSLIYGDNFIGQTKLTDAYTFCYIFIGSKVVDAIHLILPATTLTKYCYSKMFNNCTSLTTAPKLPATTLAYSCYWEMFRGCTSLTTAPKLPATTLTDWCYAYMFHSCKTLKTAPELPATTLTMQCYYSMFSNCTSLKTAPELPATTLKSNCYAYMFESCASLTTAPELPATTLAGSCYMSMFAATKITTPPELPATTLAGSCYRNMFYGCASLTVAPELPATTLQSRCYQHMFWGCSSITTAPELPATTLADYCYGWMFQRCTKLNYIKCLATNISASNSHNYWLDGVASSGTFVKSSSMTSWSSGASGIPTGWTVQNI